MLFARIGNGSVVEYRDAELVPGADWRPVEGRRPSDLGDTDSQIVTSTIVVYADRVVRTFGMTDRQIADVKASSLAMIDEARLSLERSIAVDGSPHVEKLTLYLRKTLWVNSHLSGDPSFDPMLQREADARGVELSALVALIKSKADTADDKISRIEQAYASAATAIASAATVSDVLAARDSGLSAIAAI